MMPFSLIYIELVEWRGGQVVFLPLSWSESTGSTLLHAKSLCLEDHSNPHTTKNKEESASFLPP
jgi:hypothetical protein